MNNSKELLKKAKTAKTAEELLAMAKEENIELTSEQAAMVFADLNKTGELSDEELDNVAGGGCNGLSGPKFFAKDRVSHKGIGGRDIDGTVVNIGMKDGCYVYYVVDDGARTENPFFANELTRLRA